MSTARFNTLANAAGSKSVPVDTVVDGSAKAWVNFNGTGTVAIRASFNVSSITDNGTGDYTLNFTSALTDANYAAQMTASLSSNGFNVQNINANLSGSGTTPKSTTAFRIWVKQGVSLTDVDLIDVAIFR